MPVSPGIDAAAASRGDSGKAGISGKVAAGVGVAAAAAAAAGVAASKKGTEDATVTEPDVTLAPPPVETFRPVEADTLPPVDEVDPALTARDAQSGALTEDDPLTYKNRPAN